MNLFTLMGIIAINAAAAHKALDSTSQKAKDTSGKMDKSFQKIGEAAKKCGKVIASGLAIGTAAFTSMMKTAIGDYAEYEQLVGGVKKLFGDSAGAVMKYANEAYKESGLSANDYMQTVTSFSASLIAGLSGDTEKAAELSNMAIADMADNANTFGTAMSSVQDAYQGFAKQNYTMLDNLKLGYGGTQAEMARLINDSGVLGSAITVTADTVNQVSFDKIIEAIHVIQERMEITGTTSKEAASTIAGSFSMFKASWTNLLTGLASEDSDMDTLVDNFIGSADTLAGNLTKLLPRLRQTIGRVASRVMDEARQRISAGWNNTVWPFIRDQMRLRFGIELPEDWGTFTQQVADWWDTAQQILDNGTHWVLRFLGFEEWTEADREALKQWFMSLYEAAIEGIREYIADPQRLLNSPLLSPVGSIRNAIVEHAGDANPIGGAQEMPEWVRNLALTSPLGQAYRLFTTLAPDAEEHLQSELDETDLSVDVQVNPVQSWWSRTTNWVGSLFRDSHEGRGFANGLYRVPYDGFQATLHKDEAVLNRLDAREWRSANAHGYSADNSRLEGLMNNMVRLMQQVVTNTGAGQAVVLDTGVIVGQLAPGMDRQLGSIASRRGRG